MDFGLTETQELFRNSAREFLEARESIALARKSHSDPDAHKALWREVSALGWPGLIVEDQYGGSGLGFDDLCILLEECAAALMPGPLFETTVLGASMISAHGRDDLKATLLPRIANGDAIVTLAHLDGVCRWDQRPITLTKRGGDDVWRVIGEKRFVPSGALATDFIVSATAAGGDTRLFVVPSDADGVEVHPVRVASGEPYARVVLDSVKVHPPMVLRGSETHHDDRLLQAVSRAATARAAQMAGAAGAVVRRTTEYVSGRKQFGRPIGSFQAIQHRLADMATLVRGSRHLARAAAWRITSGEDSAIAVARAKSYASEHLPGVCWAAHQSHGAIGFTWEHDLHLYTRRVVSWRAEYGDSRYWRRISADQLLSA